MQQYPADYAIGIYPFTTVKDVAEALTISKISDDTCRAVAGDIEYRINLVAQEAQKFMRHAKRTTLMPQDVDYALQALNVQPLLHPPYPLHKPSFVPVYAPEASGSNAGPSSQHPQLYFLRDEEIDLVSYLKGIHPAAGSSTVNGKHIPLGDAAKKGKNAGVRWKAHWLAVEGVQPLIKENPISQIQDDRSGTGVGIGMGNNLSSPTASAPATSSAAAARRRKLQASVSAAKTHLSQELLLFFTRITEALVPNPALPALRRADNPGTPRTAGMESATPLTAASMPTADFTESERSRQASLATLRLDPSLSDLLPYLVRWLSEMIMVSINGGTEGRTTTELEYLLDGMEALIANSALFIEPYLHQMLPPIMSILLSVPLGSESSAVATKTSTSDLRRKASDLLGTLMKTYGPDYETLIPRVTQTLQKALASPASFKSTTPTGILGTRQLVSSHGRYQGALLGLAAISNQAFLRSLLGADARGLKMLGEELESATSSERDSIVRLTMDLLTQTLGNDDNRDAIDVDVDESAVVSRFGNVFGHALADNARLAGGIERYLKQDV
ncbi:hypothetical protein QFC22_000272 [Naganishia vaughanmartiniae]|uniref:Uncharacterized protein n=1 Tax=Naganishia vaughanmartiniae TaxID=1424756 RepID=A0ACC2XNX0_9TREE|nr:hypothetical protein QFC22_000272 [Naganishia vaughanmartiniae]